DEEVIEHARDADYIFALFGKVKGPYREGKYYLLDKINRPEVTAYITDSEWTSTSYLDSPTQCAEAKINPARHRGEPWINEEMYSKCRWYFKRLVFPEDLDREKIIPCYIGACNRYFGKPEDKEFDIFCSFGQLEDGLRQPVHDYCCGLGGDLMALARRGPAVGWDRSAEMAHLATANLDVLGASEHSQVRVQEIEAMAPLPGEVWHLDPDRRSSGRRSTQMEWHSPGPEFIEHLRKIAPDGVLKLAPAAEVPEPWNQEAEREWISWNRQCRQQVVWFGALAQQSCLRRATVVTKTANCLEDPRVHSFVGQSTTRAPQGSQVEEYIYDIDPAVRAAGLTGALARDQNLVALEKESGYLTSAIFCGHPLLTGFQVLDVLPLRVKSLSSFLRKQSIGRLEIKKRGIETDPEQLRQKLKLQGEESRTLLLTRLGEREIAILAQRCLDGVTGSSLKD
ncbi:MAG: hypothetical protein CMJ72_14305, partial [Planctomycetaceae bacterium]|nr:hypothetical protein [Planctomycetaceae bacterium]